MNQLSIHTTEKFSQSLQVDQTCRSPLTFKEASKLEAQPPSPDHEVEEPFDSRCGLEEEDAPEATIGCDRMVHRTLSRTSLTPSNKLKTQKSSWSIRCLAINSSRKESIVDINLRTPGGLETADETGSAESHINVTSEMDGHSPGESDDGEGGDDGEATPTTETLVDEKLLIVDWDGPDDPENPKNWTYNRKWAATAITSAFTFVSPVSSSMLAPVSDQIAQEFGITSTVLIAMVTSLFVLGYAFGPLFLAPMSEIYGRSRVLQLANLFFLVFNLACGFSQNTAQILAFRFLSGLGGSAPLAVMPTQPLIIV